jgi:hypothetical protein
MADAEYTAEWHASHAEGVSSSAEIIVPLVMGLVGPQSVVDVGCGRGDWLAEFGRRGVPEIHGFDGPWVRQSELAIDAGNFTAADLSKPKTVALPSADLVMSLEVAEHLPASVAGEFVALLASQAPRAVLFSGAIPGQHGTGHVNPQWPDYWAELFAAHGYQPFDVIRPNCWGHPAVEYYYQQNILLYVASGAVGELEGLQPYVDRPELRGARPLVHPRIYDVYRRDFRTKIKDRLSRTLKRSP